MIVGPDQSVEVVRMTESVGKDVQDVKLCLLGFGSVGRELLAMLRDVEERIARQSGVRFLIAGITTRHAGFIDPAGITAAELLGMVESGHGSLPGPAVAPAELIAASGADVLVEATVLESGGETAAGHIEAAFAGGMDVVTVNKGPVAWQFERMRAAAEVHGRRWRYEGTVADGMPVFDLVETCLRGCTITGFDGILTGVTNYILDALGEGDSFDDAVAHTQREGWLEADPALDLDGVDSACKLAILANSLLDAQITPDEIPRQSIRSVTAERVADARAAGRRLCLLCSGRSGDDGVDCSVRLVELPLTHPLAGIHGSGLGLILHTDLMGDVLTAELDATTRQTAYAILADLLALCARR
jgi:homoserine dehydrogenase